VAAQPPSNAPQGETSAQQRGPAGQRPLWFSRSLRLRGAALVAGLSLLGAGSQRPRLHADAQAQQGQAQQAPQKPQLTQAEARLQIQKQLEALLAASPLASARVSLEVVSLDDGAQIFSRGADEQLNPASNTKLLTAAAALHRLGPEYRFTTDVLADVAPLKNKGKVKSLYVKGRGDPSFTTERLEGLAHDLAHRGLKQVGELVLDDSFFDAEFWGPGWEKEPSDTAYAAPSGALSVNHNSAAIYVIPGEKAGQKARVEMEPEAKGFFALENQVQTLKAGSRKRVIAHSFDLPDRTRMNVQGRVATDEGPLVFFRRVTNPTLYFGSTLRQALQARGVKVDKLRRGTTPESAVLVSSYDSPELGELVRDMNKVSSNFMAENILRTLGAEVKGAPGTWPKGVDAAEEALAELGVPRGGYQLRNGSGLNDTNRLSAHQLVTVLVAMWKRFPLAAEFLASLPIAARDGTLRTRMEGTDAAGRLRAKTGTLEKVRRVTTLSGYLGTQSGERLAFAFLVNDWAGGRLSVVTQAVDRFGALLAGMGQSPQSLAVAQQADLTPSERKAKVAAYAQLGAARDKKNLTMLRGAVRTERDPVVRVVAADALYRTDPDAGGGALLEALPSSPELLLELSALGRELQLPLPLSFTSPLLDLGAEGSAEALARLVALAPLVHGLPAGGDAGHDGGEPLDETLAEGLFDVSEAAPEELFTALRSGQPAAAKAALKLVAQGLAAAGAQAPKTALGQLVLLAGSHEGPEGEQARGFWAILENKPEVAAAEAGADAGPAQGAADGGVAAAAPGADGGAVAADGGAAMTTAVAPGADAGAAAALLPEGADGGTAATPTSTSEGAAPGEQVAEDKAQKPKAAVKKKAAPVKKVKQAKKKEEARAEAAEGSAGGG
jgi:D-alanyl-D-alanine carboxypeptidase/D-alanyl-D-alanine-endopeptidase (penicillin-binding protein 4)